MFDLALQNLKANRGRFMATVIAIVVGVMFLSAGLIFTDAIKSSLGGSLAERYPTVAASLTDTQHRHGPPQRVPAELLDTVLGVDGVRTAAGEVESSVGIFANGRKKPESITARRWVTKPSLNPADISSGRAPSGAGEIVVDRRTAADDGLRAGDRVDLATNLGRTTFTIVGLTRFGEDDSQDVDGTITFTDADIFTAATGGVPEFTRIIVEADPDTSPAGLVRRLEKIAPEGVAVRTRDEFLQDEAGELAQIATILKPVFTGFSLLALFVCGFVVTNTFSVVVAQRTRELALVRAIGATPRQVKRSLRFEALVIGLISSIIGVVAGYLLVVAAVRVLDAFDIRLSGAGARLTIGTFALCVAVGTLVTVAAVWGTSRRAAKIAPVEAMRSGLVDTPPGIKGLINRLVLLAIGAAVLVAGGITGNGYLLGIGSLVFVVSVLRGGRVLAVGVARVATPVLRRIGPQARLAGDNIQRNPKRAASTANALVIGVLLITLVTTAGGTIRASLVQQFDDLSTVDLQVTSDGSGLPAGLLDQISSIRGVQTVAGVKLVGAQVGGEQSLVTTADPFELKQAAGTKTTAGSLLALDDQGIAVLGAPTGVGFGPGGGTPKKMGDEVKVVSLAGDEVTLKVQAVLEFSIDAFFTSNLVTPATFGRLFGERPPTTAFVKVAGRGVSAVKADLEKLTDDYSSVDVRQGNFIGEIVDTVLGFVIGGINGLLAMSVLIAAIGVINTMTLAVIERRREIGLLRAVGMLPSEARSMVRIEAVLIALLGTVVGLVSGAFLAFWLTRSLDTGGGFTFQWTTLAIVFVVGLVVGVLASLIPARRVSRMDVLAALEE